MLFLRVALAIVLVVALAPVCLAQSMMQTNDYSVKPFNFEVTEAIGSGVLAQAVSSQAVSSQAVSSQASFQSKAKSSHGHLGLSLGKGGGKSSGKGGGKGYCYDYTLRLTSLLMDRDRANGAVLLDTASGNARVLAPDTGINAGARVNLIRNQGGGQARELVFTGLFSDNGLEFGIVHDDHVLPTMPQISILDDGVTLSNYQSSFLSVEYNHRNRRSDRLTTLWGFRWINLDEDYNYTIIAPGGPQVIAGRTEAMNNLFGFQLGTEGVIFQRGCLRIEGGIRAGAYWNMSEHDSAFAAVPFPGVAIVTDEGNDIAFQSEIEFTGVYQLNELWWARIGYQFMWLEGVALGPDQVCAMNLATMSGIDTAGSPFYHGTLFQLERRW